MKVDFVFAEIFNSVRSESFGHKLLVMYNMVSFKAKLQNSQKRTES